MGKMRKIGFTLIELLVVISIISLLMAMLMPALAEARRKAGSVICLKREKDLIQLGLMYTTQNDNLFWIGCGWGPQPKNGGLYNPRDQWFGATGKMANISKDPNGWTKDKNIRLCPMAKTPVAQDGVHPDEPFKAWQFPPLGPLHNRWEEPNVYSSYGNNSWVYSFPKIVAKNPSAYKLNKCDIVSPAKTDYYRANQLWQNTLVKQQDRIPVFMDSAWFDDWPDNNNIPPESETRDCNPNTGALWEMKVICLNRHNQRINIAYMDGSARLVALKQLWYQKWHRKSDLSGLNAPTYKDIKTGLWMARFRKE